jgi:hypothetical protein
MIKQSCRLYFSYRKATEKYREVRGHQIQFASTALSELNEERGLPRCETGCEYCPKRLAVAPVEEPTLGQAKNLLLIR